MTNRHEDVERFERALDNSGPEIGDGGLVYSHDQVLRAYREAHSQPSTTSEGKTARERLQAAWDSFPFGLPPIDFTDAEAEHIAAALSTSVQSDAPTFNESDPAFKAGIVVGLEKAASYIEGHGGVIPGANVFALMVAGNNQPCMSGDMRDRLPSHRRRQFDDAIHSLAQAIRQLIPQEPRQ